MDKQQFIEGLSTTGSLSDQQKIELCQYYIDNYSVNINGIFINLPIKINGGSSGAVDYAYQQLKKRVGEFK